MPNITVRPANGCLFMAGLPLSLSGDEVMPLDYHAGRSGWLLYGRGRISNALPNIKLNWVRRW